MALSLSDWLEVLSHADDAWTYDIAGGFESLYNIFNPNFKPVSSRNDIGKGKPYFVMGGGSPGGGSSGGLTSTSSAVNVLKPMLFSATTTGGIIALEAKTGLVTTAGGTLVKAGGAFISSPYFIMACAAACGYSIGWKSAVEIDNWLTETNFDWGVNSIQYETGLTQLLTIATKEGAHAKTFIEHDLFERLVEKLDEWGLWDERPAVTPYEPTIGEFVNYNFNNRFPNIPQQYVPRFQALIDNYNININGKYITCAVSTDDHIRLIVFQSGYLNFLERSNKFNNLFLVTPSEVCCSVRRGNLEEHVVAYDMKANGEMSIAWQQDIGYLPLTIYGGVDGWIFDNFGTDYREIIGNSTISTPTDDLNSIAADSTATDLRNGPLSLLAPAWWAERILLSAPDIYQKPRSIPASEPLNEQEVFIPVAIPSPAVNSGIQQWRVWEGVTDDDVAEDIINKTPEVVPKIGVDPAPTPVNPPTPTPTVPDIHLSPWGVSDSGMISLYNPTSLELQLFSQWLWGFDFDSTIKKLLQDPMEAIIGLHMVYATPNKAQESKAHIIIGRVDSECSSDLIKQYATVSCGEPVYIAPYTNNVHDYISVSVQLFLPFVGIVSLNTAEVIGRFMKIQYQVDFLTGTCLAIVSLSSDNSNYFTAYTFAGNCAVQLPITGANYAGILGNIVGLAGSVAATALTSGAAAPAIGAAMSGVGLVNQLGHTVQRSGGLGANAGAMGQKIPYLIISRHPAAEAYNRGGLQGLPQSMRAKLGSCVGFTRITDINLNAMSCTETEKDIIKSKLQAGVII